MHEQAIERLRQAGRRHEFVRGEHLMTIGADSDEVLLLESGVVKVMLSAGDGAETLVDLYGPGELIGELGVLTGQVRSATVIGHSPGVAVHVTRAAFRSLTKTQSAVILMVNDTLDRRLRNADTRQVAMASKSVLVRLAGKLLDWANRFGEWTDDGLLVSGVVQKELAQAIGASEKSVDSAMKRLRDAGLLRTARLSYLLPEPDLLEARLADPDWRLA